MAKVLIVDDSMFTRNRIIKMVEEMGHETIEAPDGQEGLDKILNEKPDIVITDLLMPKMEGTELLSAVKERKLNVPVIVVSSNIQDTVRQECLELGASGFLSKPPNTEELQKLIEVMSIKGGSV
jgi:CheY-like chemotaxis protein